MRRVTASDARKNWFRILDEVAAGDVVVVERGDRRILIQREETAATNEPVPDYSGLIRAPEAELAEHWGWEWAQSGGDLQPIEVDEE
jgi:hypothetical protein